MASKVLDLIKKKDAYKLAGKAAAGAGALGGIVGYSKGKKDGMKKKAETNKYLDKLAGSIGAIGKALVRGTTNKTIPDMVGKMSKSQASNVHAISRGMAGSKVVPKVFSTPEQAQHMSAMHGLGKKLMPTTGGMDATKTSKILAVATRARRMQLSKAGQ